MYTVPFGSDLPDIDRNAVHIYEADGSPEALAANLDTEEWQERPFAGLSCFGYPAPLYPVPRPAYAVCPAPLYPETTEGKKDKKVGRGMHCHVDSHTGPCSAAAH